MRLQALCTPGAAVRPLVSAAPFPCLQTVLDGASPSSSRRSCTSTVSPQTSPHTLVTTPLMDNQQFSDVAPHALLWFHALTLLMQKLDTPRLFLEGPEHSLPFDRRSRADGNLVVGTDDASQSATGPGRSREQGTGPKPYMGVRIRKRTADRWYGGDIQ